MRGRLHLWRAASMLHTVPFPLLPGTLADLFQHASHRRTLSQKKRKKTNCQLGCSDQSTVCHFLPPPLRRFLPPRSTVNLHSTVFFFFSVNGAIWTVGLKFTAARQQNQMVGAPHPTPRRWRRRAGSSFDLLGL